MARGLCIALEEERIIAEAVADAEVREAIGPVIPDAAESPETAMLEMQETVTEGEIQSDEVDDAIEVREALNEYQDVLGDISAEGGLSTESLQILNIGLKQLYKRVGIPNTSLAMESYGSRKELSVAAMESISEKAGQVFKAIVDAIKRGIQWMVDFFKNLFSSTKRMKDRAAKLKELAHKAGSVDTSVALTEGVSHIASKLSMAGKVDAQYATEVTLALLTKAVMPMYSEVTSISSALGKTITSNEAAKQFSSTVDSVTASMRSMSKLTFGGNVLPGEMSFKIDIDGINAPLDELSKIQYNAMDNADPFRRKLTKIVSLLNASVTAAKNSMQLSAADTKAPESLTPLSGSEMTHALDNVDKILAEIIRFETEGKKLESECNRIIRNSNIAHFVTQAGAVFDPQAAVRKEILNLTSRFLSLGNYLSGRFVSIGLNVSKSVMDYCELSLKKASQVEMSSSTAMVPA